LNFIEKLGEWRHESHRVINKFCDLKRDEYRMQFLLICKSIETYRREKEREREREKTMFLLEK